VADLVLVRPFTVRTFLILVIVFTAWCAPSWAGTPEERVDAALKRIDATVKAYGGAYPKPRYPRSISELFRFAGCIGRPLDLSPFSSISLKRSRATFMSISYQSNVPSREAGILAYSVIY
jgi:hypothetical protein